MPAGPRPSCPKCVSSRRSSFFFWEHGKKGSPWWMMAAGGCLAAAGAMKLSSLDSAALPSSCSLRGVGLFAERFDRRRLVLFVAGAALGICCSGRLPSGQLATVPLLRRDLRQGELRPEVTAKWERGFSGFLSVLRSPAGMHPGVSILTIFLCRCGCWSKLSRCCSTEHARPSAVCRRPNSTRCVGWPAR